MKQNLYSLNLYSSNNSAANREGVINLKASYDVGWQRKVGGRSSYQGCSTKKDVLRNFAKFTGKHPCQSLSFNKVAGLRSPTLLKKRLWHRYLPVNFVKFLITPFYIEHLWWLLLMRIVKCIFLRFTIFEIIFISWF